MAAIHTLKDAITTIGEIKDDQSEIVGDIKVLKQAEKYRVKEAKELSKAIGFIMKNMVTKEDMKTTLDEIKEVETDLDEHVEATRLAMEEIKESQEENMRRVESSFSTALAAFKVDIMPMINRTAKTAGDGMVKTAFLTGKFTIVWAIAYTVVTGLVGGAIALFWRGIN
jgi:vacuolar-type H+-ATPase subunit H